MALKLKIIRYALVLCTGFFAGYGIAWKQAYNEKEAQVINIEKQKVKNSKDVKFDNNLKNENEGKKKKKFLIF